MEPHPVEDAVYKYASFGLALIALGALGCSARGHSPTADGGGVDGAGGTRDGAPSTCNNGRQDGDETHLDCGGSCSPCPDGAGCTVKEDCESGVCTNESCMIPTCSDGVKNGREAGVDCGTISCPRCEPGQGCRTGADCKSGVCWSGTCEAPTCTDGVKNGDEAGVDCGGAECDEPCPD